MGSPAWLAYWKNAWNRPGVRWPFRSWSKEKLVFREKNLQYISHYLSRWYDIRISVDPAIATEYVYTFTLGNEPVEEVMRIMARLNPIEYRFTEDNCLRISKKRGL